MPTLIATPGGSTSNSYETLAEAQAYFDARLPLAGWDEAADQTVLLVMATRQLDALLNSSARTFVPATSSQPAYWRTPRHWKGAPTTTTQRLAWPRTGMVDENGNAIPDDVIPDELKEAESEFAGQLGTTDRTLDNDVVLQGLTSVKAGSVALTFKDYIERNVIPQAVWDLMPPSWFTDEVIELVFQTAEFDVIA